MKLPTQMFAGTRPRLEAFIIPEADHDHVWKPSGGLWTSTLVDGTSDWERWCREESFHLEAFDERWTLEPLDAHVFAIRQRADVERLLSLYGVDRYPDRPEWGGLRHETLRWAEFAADWDALWLESQWIDMGGIPLRLASMMFYGWDCESTWWARWKFGKIRRLKERMPA